MGEFKKTRRTLGLKIWTVLNQQVGENAFEGEMTTLVKCSDSKLSVLHFLDYRHITFAEHVESKKHANLTFWSV